MRLLRNHKLKEILMLKDMHEVNADTDLYSRTLHMDLSLRKFQIANAIYVVITTILTTIVYAILKYADSSHIRLYNTHTYQYLYKISGVYLKIGVLHSF